MTIKMPVEVSFDADNTELCSDCVFLTIIDRLIFCNLFHISLENNISSEIKKTITRCAECMGRF